ncbi:hypothetical protein, partial [Escherichia coli]|uniref:hypothetical protein n=1 Tax=Escherichia coli TaxID=562 RepID=UPI003265026E
NHMDSPSALLLEVRLPEDEYTLDKERPSFQLTCDGFPLPWNVAVAVAAPGVATDVRLPRTS